MELVRLPAWNHRKTVLSIIAAAAALAALLALSPSPAQGQTVDSPATMQECREEMLAGRAVSCARNFFSVLTMLPDGGYHINWSEWAGRHDNVERYTIQRLRFQYRYNFTLESDGSAVSSADYTVPDVNSCRPYAAERDGMREVTRWAWSCNGITNVREDPSGAPTSVELLADNWTSTSWTGALLAPGRKHDIPVSALRIPGDRDAAHADNPQSASDRLTQQQVDDGTQSLLASDLEMHLYYITVHFDDGTIRRSYQLADGSPYDDRQ